MAPHSNPWKLPSMTRERPVLYFDFIDPLSYLMGQELAASDEMAGRAIEWRPLELRPPPTPLTTLDDPELAVRWARAGSADALGRPWAPPPLVPWTRKAHELVRFASESDQASEAREAVFVAYLIEGLDIGRIDVLVDIARRVGLDPGEVKPTLDVDRFEADVSEPQEAVRASGITTVPAVALEARVLEGFHNAAAIRTFLGT